MSLSSEVKKFIDHIEQEDTINANGKDFEFCSDDLSEMFHGCLGQPLKDYLATKNIEIAHVEDFGDLSEGGNIYLFTRDEESVHVKFWGPYDSYESIHNYEGWKIVEPKQVTVTQWDDV